jgi:hypothetical protein
MNVTNLNVELNPLVSKGDMIKAVINFFADNSITIDHTGVMLANKKEHLVKWEVSWAALQK